MRKLVVAFTVVALAGVAATSASAHTLSTRAALKKTAQVARTVGLQTGATEYYAFGCTRRTAHVVDCIGAVVYQDGEACGQIVRVSYKSHAAKTVAAARRGQAICGYPDEEEYPEPSGSGGETAICAIRQSVCI